MLTKEEYETKRQTRYERLIAAAERAERESKANYAQSDRMASVIPFGQPILVGHYSENSDRRHRERIHNKMRKGYELAQKADELRARAEATKNNRAIFSDDPSAIEKLTDRITRLEKRQELMKAANKCVRSNDREGLAALGFSETIVNGLFTPDFCGRLGFANYMLTNNNANIRRLKSRVVELEARSQEETTEREVDNVRIVDNTDMNRLQVFFPGKPDEETRRTLKSYGFRWTPSLGCWQAYRNNRAQWALQKLGLS